MQEGIINSLAFVQTASLLVYAAYIRMHASLFLAPGTNYCENGRCALLAGCEIIEAGTRSPSHRLKIIAFEVMKFACKYYLIV
jgi:hypothetical protein